MSQLSIHLSPKHRLDFKLVKRRGVISEPLLPSLEELRKTRRGHKTSRFFRHIFEHKKIKNLLGSSLAAIVLANSFVPSYPESRGAVPEQTVMAIEETPLTTERGVAFPVQNPIVTQGYHLFHLAIDFEGITGDPVNPIMAGVVAKIQYSSFGLGNAILIDHGNEFTSVYAHLSKIQVKEGQAVTTSTIIGRVGATGHAFGDHLHLEIHKDGRPINPFAVLPAIGQSH